MSASDYLLIARKGGTGDEHERRQRRFPTLQDVERAVERWRKDGFDTWWVFAPKTEVKPGTAPRRLVRQWEDARA